MPRARHPLQYNLKKRFDVDENRELTNDILKAALRGYGDPFGFVQAAFKIDADPRELLQTAPGLIDTLVAAGHLKKGTLTKHYAGVLPYLLEELIPTLARASGGDEFAEKQIKAIGKILEPQRYELPVTVLEQLLEKHHTRPALARGWAIRSLMGELSWVVEPGKAGNSVLEGPVRLTSNQGVKEHQTHWDKDMNKGKGGWRSTYEVALAHWPKRGAPTLKSLAIKVYLRRLRDEGFTTISEATLENDLQELAEWDKTHSEDNKRYLGVRIHNAGGEDTFLAWQQYSEGWKQSKHYEKNRKILSKGSKVKLRGEIQRGDKKAK